MYAIFETGGKQYTAKVGDQLYIEKVEVEAGSMIAFNKVLALGEEGKLDVGAPYLDGASVVAKILKTGKGKKIIVMTYRAKKNSKRKQGHRQPYTKVEITEIQAQAKQTKKTAAKKKEAPAQAEAAEE